MPIITALRDDEMTNLRLPTIVLLAIGAFALTAGRTPDAFGDCAPGCKICLLDVCSEVGPQRPGERKSGSGQQQPQGPISDDPAVNLDNKLKGLNPGDTSSPVTEWVVMSKKDFVLSMVWDFIFAGYCRDVKRIPDEIKNLPSCYRHCYGIKDGKMSDCEDKCYLTASERDERNRSEHELLKRLEEANAAIKKSSYDCGRS